MRNNKHSSGQQRARDQVAALHIQTLSRRGISPEPAAPQHGARGFPESAHHPGDDDEQERGGCAAEDPAEQVRHAAAAEWAVQVRYKFAT